MWWATLHRPYFYSHVGKITPLIQRVKPVMVSETAVPLYVSSQPDTAFYQLHLCVPFAKRKDPKKLHKRVSVLYVEWAAVCASTGLSVGMIVMADSICVGLLNSAKPSYECFRKSSSCLCTSATTLRRSWLSKFWWIIESLLEKHCLSTKIEHFTIFYGKNKLTKPPHPIARLGDSDSS